MNAKKILAVWSFMLIAIFLMGCQQVDQVVTPDDSLQKTLDENEIAGVVKMIWSEKLARDVYTDLGEYGDVFSNIASTEQKHMDSLISMLFRHAGVSDPTAGFEKGEFSNEESALKILYDSYVQVVDLPEALNAGIEIETLLMNYYKEILDAVYVVNDIEFYVVTHPGLKKLYANLYNGSFNHLSAFNL